MKYLLHNAMLVLGLASPLAFSETPNNPYTSADLSCSELKIQLIDVGADLITPGKVEFKQEFAASFARDKTLAKRMQMASKQDPVGLCHYRDENQSLAHNDGKRIVFIGDSITEGWSKAKQALFNEHVINRGVAGQNTQQMLLRFRQDVLDLHPAVVHIMGGINDFAGAEGAVLTLSNIQSMIDVAKANNIKVILSTITPSAKFWLFPKFNPVPYILYLNQEIRLIAKKNNLVLVDYFAVLSDQQNGLKPEMTNDGLHPNQLGYDAMITLTNQAIAEAL